MVVREAAVRASTYGHEPAQLRARIAEYARADRARRAFRRFLPIFGAACGVLLIPPHLVWWAIVTIAGSVLALQRFRQRAEILELSGPCPDCAAQQTLPPPDALPAIQRCPSCGAFLKLEEVA
jgi:hypothetical protein